MQSLNRTQLLRQLVNLLIKRKQSIGQQDVMANLQYWEKQFDIDTPLIEEIIHLTEDYVNKYKNFQGCIMIFLFLLVVVLSISLGWIGFVIGVIVSLLLLGKHNFDDKDLDKNKIIEKKTHLETNFKKRAAEGNIIPEKFANVKAIRQAKKILAENPNLSFKELFSLLEDKKETYKKTLTPQQRKIVAELPYFIDSYYIFNYGRSDKL